MSKLYFLLILAWSSLLSAREIQLGVNYQQEWMKLPRIAVSDGHGTIKETDSEGRVDITDMAAPLYVLIDRGSFYYSGADGRYYAQLQEVDYLGEQVDLGNHFEQKLLVAWSALETTRQKVLQLGLGLDRYGWFFEQIPVNLAYSDGCNAAFDGRELLLFTGDHTCIPSSLSPDLIIHEYGHALIGNLTGAYRGYEQDYSEGFSDALMAIVGHDPLFGEGFYRYRLNSHLRDLRYFVSYPEGWRGLYSGSLIFSTLVWKMHEHLEKYFSIQALEQILLTALIRGTQALTSNMSPQIVEGGKLFIQHLNELLVEQGREDLICLGEYELSRRGMSLQQRACDLIRTASYKGQRVEATSAFQIPAVIPDAGTREILFQIPRVNGRLKKIQLLVNIDHIFPDDLTIDYRSGRRTYHLYKGIEELSIPASLEIPVEHIQKNRELRVIIKDTQATLEGSLQSSPFLKIYY